MARKSKENSSLGVGQSKNEKELAQMPKGRYQYRQSGTLIRSKKKVRRNDPCPCGAKKTVIVKGVPTSIPVKAKNCHFPNL